MPPPPPAGSEPRRPWRSKKQRAKIRRILRDAPDLAPPGPVEELTRRQASEFTQAHRDRIIPAAELAGPEVHLRWLRAIAEQTGTDPEAIPALTASQAGRLIDKWAPKLPRRVRQRLGAEEAGS